MPFDDSTRSRVENPFKDLTAAVTRLNKFSDELAAIIAEVEGGLKNINLGVAAWVQVEMDEEPNGDFVLRQIGYDKLPKGWCIALGSTAGNDNIGPEVSRRTEWAFNEGPRWLRVKAIDYLPALIIELNRKADELTKHVSEKIGDARQITDAMKAAVPAGAVKK